MRILIIDISKEKLHYFEFVKPIHDILEKELSFVSLVKKYKEVSKKDLEKCDKVIICGTSLKDNEFMKNENLECFQWLLNFNKSVLGICGGMHVIGLIFGKSKKFLIKKTEIGYYREIFNKNFLGVFGEQEVYHLHNYFFDFSNLKEFEIFNKGSIAQAVKHKEKKIYGVLFHPEVRQKNLIKNFCFV